MHNPSADSGIYTSLPKPWEQEESFHDALYDWIRRAPWLAISLAAHGVLFFIIQAIPWNLFEEQQEVILIATIEQPPEAEFLDELPPEQEEIKEEESEEEPVIQDVEITETHELDSDEDMDANEGDPDQLANSPFDSQQLNRLIGIGGNAGGRYGPRFGGRRDGPGEGGGGTETALREGLEWLKRHQSPQGYWEKASGIH